MAQLFLGRRGDFQLIFREMGSREHKGERFWGAFEFIHGDQNAKTNRDQGSIYPPWEGLIKGMSFGTRYSYINAKTWNNN